MMKGWALTQSHADFLVFFVLFWTMDHRTRLVPIARTIDGPSALVLANARKSSFILVFNVPSPKCFAQPGDHHSCQASNTGSALERRKKFSKNTRGRSRSSQKHARWRSGVFKKTSKTSSKPKPQSWNVWRQIFQKRGKQKTRRNGHNSGKKRDIFELRTKIVPREPPPKHSGVAESLPRPQLVIHPWRIYPSYGHWDDHFGDGYIRHMALNGLSWRQLRWFHHLSRCVLKSSLFTFQVKVSLSRKRRQFGAPTTLTDRDASDPEIQKVAYAEFASYSDDNFELQRLELDKGIQVQEWLCGQ